MAYVGRVNARPAAQKALKDEAALAASHRARAAGWASGHQRQHDGNEDRRVDPALLLAALLVVAAVHADHQVEIGHDIEALAAPADAPDPGMKLRLAGSGGLSKIPVLAILATGIDADGRRGDPLHPVGGHELASLPSAIREKELANLHHVARQQTQA